MQRRGDVVSLPLLLEASCDALQIFSRLVAEGLFQS